MNGKRELKNNWSYFRVYQLNQNGINHFKENHFGIKIWWLNHNLTFNLIFNSNSSKANSSSSSSSNMKFIIIQTTQELNHFLNLLKKSLHKLPLQEKITTNRKVIFSKHFSNKNVPSLSLLLSKIHQDLALIQQLIFHR